MNRRTPSCVWRATPELITTLQDRLGDPLDAYVNGSQVWLRQDGLPEELTIEWRLHPVASYQRPVTVSTASVFAATAFAIANDSPLPAPLDQLWDGLEAFPAYGHPIDSDQLAEHVTNVLGIRPDEHGLVDHTSIGNQWERTRGSVSIVRLLFESLDEDEGR